MHPNLLLNKIERKYSVETIIAEGLPVWEFLRNIYSDKLLKKYCHYSEKRKASPPNILYNYFWRHQKVKKNFQVVLFTDVLEERIVEGLIKDKIAGNLLKITQNQSLVVLDPGTNKHKQISQYSHTDMLSAFSFILPAKLKFKNIYIQNIECLNKIELEIQLRIPYKKLINQFFQFVEIFQFWIQKYQPKIIFINCYFSLRHQALIYAAKQNDVLTVEFQHGIISKGQTAYFPQKDFGQLTFPNYLLCFGKIEKELISNNFINSEKIIPIGNYYLEYMMKQKITTQNKETAKLLRKKYNRIILISSQDLIERELIEILSDIAKKLPQIVFVFVPRKESNKINYSSLPPNILIKPKIDLYQFCSLCDFHSTVFSTFALESSYMGTPNIFINIKGLSKIFYKDIFSNHTDVKFADDVKEYIEIIKNWSPPEKTEIKLNSKRLFSDNNHDRIKQFLNEISEF